MSYRIQQLAKLAGISTRTLRHYDDIGLLVADRDTDSNYRLYDDHHVDRLQQILLYRRLGMSLDTIRKTLDDTAYDPLQALLEHRDRLLLEQQRMRNILDTVNRSISHLKGDKPMNQRDKFNGLREELIATNERDHGEEIRTKYGEDAVAQSYAKMRKLSKHEFQTIQQLGEDILAKLGEAMRNGAAFDDPIAMDICAMHERWIRYFWNTYSPQAHLGLTQMYVDDERFRAYYDNAGAGAAVFLNQAMQHYHTKKG